MEITDNARIDRVSSLITGVLSRRGVASQALASMALHRINGWLGERFPSPKAAVARSIVDGVLLVECSHSVILQELQLQMVELKAFCNAECTSTGISDIRIARSGDAPGNALAPGNPPA